MCFILLYFCTKKSHRRDIPAPPEKSTLPRIEGCMDAPFRQEGYIAFNINKKLAAARNIQKYGPRHHLKSSIPEPDIEALGERDTAVSVEMIQPHPNDLLQDNPRPSLYQDFKKMTTNRSSPHNNLSLPALSTIEADPSSPRAAVYRRYKHALKRRSKSNDTHTKQHNNNDLFDDELSVGSSVTTQINANALNKPNKSNVNDDDDDDNEVDVKEALKIIIVPENELARPLLKLQALFRAKCNRVKTSLERRFADSFNDMLRWAFNTWVIKLP